MAEALRPWRLLIAVKTAGAATAAWVLGHYVPGEAGDYAYYAPFGAIVAMLPTLAASVRSAVRMVVSATLGLLLAWGLLLLGLGGVAAVAAAIGVGTLIAGLPALGEERMYVPLGAVFVFVASGTDPDGFSLGYGLQLALGAAIGVAVNLLVPPAPGSREAESAVSGLRASIAGALGEYAEALADPRGDPFDWGERLDRLDQDADRAGTAVMSARRALSGNLRAARLAGRVRRASEHGQALREVMRHLHAFSVSPKEGVPGREAESLARAVALTAEVVRGEGDIAGLADEARSALRTATTTQQGNAAAPGERAHVIAAALGRVVDELAGAALPQGLG